MSLALQTIVEKPNLPVFTELTVKQKTTTIIHCHDGLNSCSCSGVAIMTVCDGSYSRAI